METDQVGRVVGKRLYAAQGCQQSETVDGELVGVALWNDRVVVGIAAFDETAGNLAIAKVNLCIALVETDDDILTVLTQQIRS